MVGAHAKACAAWPVSHCLPRLRLVLGGAKAASSYLFWHTRGVAQPTACCGQGALREAGVTVLGGPRASQLLGLKPAPGARVEYGCNTLTLELVAGLDEAIEHIHAQGSGHTEAIVTGAGGCAVVCALRRCCDWSHMGHVGV